MQPFTHEMTKIIQTKLTKKEQKNRSREENWERCERIEVRRRFIEFFKAHES
jgi:hypothetical protein